jgi:hypothetical protein
VRIAPKRLAAAVVVAIVGLLPTSALLDWFFADPATPEVELLEAVSRTECLVVIVRWDRQLAAASLIATANTLAVVAGGTSRILRLPIAF